MAEKSISELIIDGFIENIEKAEIIDKERLSVLKMRLDHANLSDRGLEK